MVGSGARDGKVVGDSSGQIFFRAPAKKLEKNFKVISEGMMVGREGEKKQKKRRERACWIFWAKKRAKKGCHAKKRKT